MQAQLGTLRRRLVVGSGGKVFGDLEDVLIDWATWRVVSVIVRVDSGAVEALGLRKPAWRRARLSIPVDQVASIGHEVVLETTLDHFGVLLDEDAIDVDVL